MSFLCNAQNYFRLKINDFLILLVAIFAESALIDFNIPAQLYEIITHHKVNHICFREAVCTGNRKAAYSRTNAE